MRGLWMLGLLSGCYDQFRGQDDPDWTSWDDVATSERVPVRVASWNVEVLGEVDSRQYDAALAVLRRINADVVLLNEIESAERDALNALGADLGYPLVRMPEGQPFGDLNNVVMSRLPEVETRFPDGADLSGDVNAEDLTRRVVVHTVTIPGTTAELSVVGVHWKSGFALDDLFRRSVDSYRTAQAIESVAASDYRLMLGDLNAEEADMPEFPAVLEEAPDALSLSYSLGFDLNELLAEEGLRNDPYAVMASVGMTPVDLAQRDGEQFTRPESGRRIDRVLADAAAFTAGIRGEVYNSRLDTVEYPSSLTDGTPRPDGQDAARAADHLPLVVEIRVKDQ